MAKSYYEFRGTTSKKFWEIDTKGKTVTVRFGKIGTDGQMTVKTFGAPDVATAHAAKVTAEKLKKGYRKLNASSAARVAKPKADMKAVAHAARPTSSHRETSEVLEAVCATYGLPTRLATRGRITERSKFKYKTKYIGEMTEDSTAWLKISRDDNGKGGASYSNVVELLAVVDALIGDHIDETTLRVKVKSGRTRGVEVEEQESVPKSCKFRKAISMDTVFGYIRKSLIEDGEDEEDVTQLDDAELEDDYLRNFLLDRCKCSESSVQYSTGGPPIFLEWGSLSPGRIEVSRTKRDLCIVGVHDRGEGLLTEVTNAVVWDPDP